MLTQTSEQRADTTQAKSTGLTVDERRYMLAWVQSARESGIDATEDLRLRPWPVPITANVIGVFRVGEEMAAWLVVGQGGLWSVVAVAQSRILATEATLAEALEIIHPLPAEASWGDSSHDEAVHTE